jgi:outer membrane protein insertion porin family
MKAAVKLISIAAAMALNVVWIAPAAVTVQLAATSVAEAAVVSRIEVRGNRRVDSETIRSYLGIAPGKPFSNGDVDAAVKKLFASGMFSDVRINQSGGTLVVEVDEYSIVNQVLFQGNKKIKDAVLSGTVQLKPRGTFSNAQMEADAQAIRDAYSRIGREDATVTTQTVDLGENRVNVVFEINEGGRTKIAKINFVGNNAFSDGRLADVISTKRSGLLSFLFRNDIYGDDRLRSDEEALRRYYFNHGYADFRVISSSGELDAASNEYTVTFTVEEGERYNFGDVSVESTISGVDSQSLNALIESEPGHTYRAKDVEDTIIALTERVAGMGYAFAQVTPRGDRNFEARTISVVYTIDEGPRTYISRIEIRGNARTRDYVIRREFDLSEGDAFNQVLVQRAKRRLEDLDYFERVEISTVPGEQPDQVVLVVDVVEKATGEFSIGAGYATDDGQGGGGIQVEGSIVEKNFLGRGQYIKVSVAGGEDTRDFTLSFTEPYFLGRRISAGFDIYRTTRNYLNYESQTTGGSVRLGLPITEALTTQLAYNLSQEEYNYSDSCDSNGDGIPDTGVVLPPPPDGPGGTNTCIVSPAIVDGVSRSPWIKSSVSGTLLFNTIDNIKNPRDGIYANFTTEVAGLGGDANFLKVSGRASYYKTLSDEMDIVGLLVLGGGHVQPLGSEDLRVFDLFKNSDRMIRGFEYAGIGPADPVSKEGLGGTTYFHGTVEAQFPLPAVPESYGLKAALFADAATVYGNPYGPAVSKDMAWRASVGIGLLWASPFGPLRVDYAVPVMKEPTDKVQNFNFGISTRF